MNNGNGKKENQECSIVSTRLPIQVQLQCAPAFSLVDAGAGLGWLVLVFRERKTLLAGWFWLAASEQEQLN